MNTRAILAALEKRDALLRQLRDFFHQRDFVEVETPLLAAEVIPELHIEPFRLSAGELLQASPELHMKQLLAAGATAIVQVTRSFRQGERGRLHNPEFTIVEWYRVGDDMQAGMNLLDELTQTLLGTPPAARTSYAHAFQQHISLCPHTASLADLSGAAVAAGAELPSRWDPTHRDEWLNLLLSLRVEPQLGGERPEIIYHYPATQASLAKVVPSGFGYNVAERFELYYHGIELANGFHELQDAAALRARFAVVNAARVADGRPAIQMPEQFLATIERRLPACTGVALGFDRLAMLAIGAASIDEVITFPQKLP